MSDLANVIAGEAANALREIGALAGVPSTVDVLLHLPDLVDWVRATAERAATVRVVTADRDALLRQLTAERAALLARVGADALAEVER